MAIKQKQNEGSKNGAKALDTIKKELKEGWLALMQVGDWISSNGSKNTFTTKRLDDIVSEYDGEADAAPLVIGHPKKDTERAFGWFSEVKRVGDFLLGKPKDLDPVIKDANAKGWFRKLSISLRGNKLVHVGLLGAVPPGVKGLGDAVLLSEGDEGDLVIEFTAPEDFCEIEIPSDYRFDSIGRFMRTMREREIAENGVEAADKYYPQWWIDDLLRPRPAFKTSCNCGSCAACATAKYNEGENAPTLEIEMSNGNPKPATVPAVPAVPAVVTTPAAAAPVDFSAQLETERAENARLKKQMEDRDATDWATRKASFAEKLKTQITPANKEIFFAALDVLKDAGDIEFTEGTGKVKAPLVDKFVSFLEGNLKKAVNFKETATRSTAAKTKTAPQSDDVVKAAKEFSAKVKKVVETAAKEGKTISFMEAVEEVKAQAEADA